MDIKWTSGPGPAPLPYSKRAREAMGVTDDDKPWAHPDPPTAASLGLDGDPLREGRLQGNLFLVLMTIIVGIWVYRKFVKRDRNPFFYVEPTASEEAEMSEEQGRTAREARLKRFDEQKRSYADIMAEAAGGWTPGGNDSDNNDNDGSGSDGGGGGASAGDGAAGSEGLRRRGDKQGD